MKTLKHYPDFSTYTFHGLYQEKLKNDLPTMFGKLVFLFAKTLRVYEVEPRRKPQRQSNSFSVL